MGAWSRWAHPSGQPGWLHTFTAALSLAGSFPTAALLGPRWPVEFEAIGHRQEEAASPALV